MSSRQRAPLSLVVGEKSQPASDAVLAQRLIDGDQAALTEAWRRFAPMVLTTAERALGSRSTAEDVAQEVFYRLFRTAKGLRDPNALRSFVYSIAVRVLKSQLRYQRVRAWLTLRRPETLVDLRHVTLDVESRELLRRFYTLLCRLSDRDRLVFILRRVDHMTVEETADVMGVSPATVKRSMSHATERLARWVGADPSLAELAEQLAARSE